MEISFPTLSNRDTKISFLSLGWAATGERRVSAGSPGERILCRAAPMRRLSVRRGRSWDQRLELRRRVPELYFGTVCSVLEWPCYILIHMNRGSRRTRGLGCFRSGNLAQYNIWMDLAGRNSTGPFCQAHFAVAQNSSRVEISNSTRPFWVQTKKQDNEIQNYNLLTQHHSFMCKQPFLLDKIKNPSNY